MNQLLVILGFLCCVVGIVFFMPTASEGSSLRRSILKYTTSYFRWSGIRSIINQDSLIIHHILLNKKEILFCAVADGIGSLEYGEEASGYCLHTLSDWFYSTAKDLLVSNSPLDLIELSLQDCIKNIQLYLADYQRHHHMDMGTTVTGLLCVNKEFLLLHIGDSKGLLISRNSLSYRIKSLFSKSRLRVNITQKTYDNIDSKGRLVACIGMSGKDKAFFFRGHLKKNSLWLLGTDGIIFKDNYPFIQKSFSTFFHLTKEILQVKLEALGRNAVSLGSKDNMAVIGVVIR